MKRYMLVATVKNEGVNIFEWVAHHRAIGFTDIVVYENGSTDLTRRQLRVMESHGFIKYFRNEFHRGEGQALPYQNRAYKRASRLPEYAECEWCIALDGDEFLNIHIGDGQLTDLLDHFSDADQIILPWRVFGCSGHEEISDHLYCEKFTYGWGDDHDRISRYAIKTLFKTASYVHPGIHRPRRPKKPINNIAYGSGRTEKNNEVFEPKLHNRYAIAQINHYMTRDAQSLLLSRVRGSSSNTSRNLGLLYWLMWNWNTQQDLTIQKYNTQLKAEMDAMDQKSNGRLSMMRLKNIRIWKEMFGNLMKDPDVNNEYQLILKTQPTPLEPKASMGKHSFENYIKTLQN